MSSKISLAIKKKTKPNDVFYTPDSLVDVHLKIMKEFVDDNDVIYDPFYGKGAYYNKFKEYFKNDCDYTEIELGSDFFTYDKEVDVIISNPPYSCIDKVLEKSVNLNPHTISYLIGHGNLTPRRIKYMNDKGYFLEKIFFTKVWLWFGFSMITVFTKKSSKNCIDFDRVIYK